MLDDRRLRTRGCWRQATVGAASMTGIGNFFFAAAIHPGRDRATPTTPFEIGGATQVWHSSARYAPFRASLSSSCHTDQDVAHSRFARAQTSDDIRPRALCTPPPKSFARSPGRCTQPRCHGIWCGQHLSRPEYTSKPKVTFAPAYCAAGPPSTSRAIAAGFHMISKRDRRRRTVKKAASWLPADPGPRQARAL